VSKNLQVSIHNLKKIKFTVGLKEKREENGRIAGDNVIQVVSKAGTTAAFLVLICDLQIGKRKRQKRRQSKNKMAHEKLHWGAGKNSLRGRKK
jgi:hypothetical protein